VKRKSSIFEELLAGVQRSRGAASGTRAAAPTFQIDAVSIRKLRGTTRLSQPQFAELRRREPTGPARALLRAIRNDPERVIRALARPA
jgi:putative transcriptional regulator